MPKFKQSDAQLLMKTSPDPKVSAFAHSTATVKALTAVLNATLEVAKEPPKGRLEVTAAVIKKGAALTGLGATATGSKTVEAASFMGGQLVRTVALRSILNAPKLSPTKAAITITLSMAETVVGAAGLAEFDKCKMEITSLAVTTATGTFTCVGTLGWGCAIGALSIAAEAFDMYGQCYRR